MTEEEKGKARVIAIMCGGVIPAWAMPDPDEPTESDTGTDDE